MCLAFLLHLCCICVAFVRICVACVLHVCGICVAFVLYLLCICVAVIIFVFVLLHGICTYVCMCVLAMARKLSAS